MHTKIGIGVAAATLVVGSSAWAQEDQTAAPRSEEMQPSYMRSTVLAPRKAFEIGLSTAYTQPFGKINDARNIGNIAQAGVGLGVELGYRISPHVGIGVSGVYHESAPADALGTGMDVRGLATSLQGTYHFMPYERVDPYLTLGAGYRMLWQVPEARATTLTHGFQLAKLQAGLDVRVSKDVALGPFVGADLDLFIWDNAEGPTGNVAMENKRVNTFLTAGIQGRFDMGGTREAKALSVASVPSPTFESNITITPTPAPASQPAESSTLSEVNIDASIMSACGISQPKAFFQYDSAAVKPGDTDTLDQVAACFSTGPLQGRSAVIVGRADPRGTEEYNKELGFSRAASVASYLAGRGMGSGQMNLVSRGEEGAHGNGPEGWARDRRVDIRLKK